MQNLKDAPLGYVIAESKNGITEEGNVQVVGHSSAGPTAPMKTLIVMTPVTKGLNMAQVNDMHWFSVCTIFLKIICICLPQMHI